MGRDLVGVGHNEQLPKVALGKRSQLLKKRRAPVGVLTSEDLVQDDEASLGAALSGQSSRKGKPKAKRSEILFASGEPSERVRRAAVNDFQQVRVIESRASVAAPCYPAEENGGFCLYGGPRAARSVLAVGAECRSDFVSPARLAKLGSNRTRR
jgi:hypothetical protein